MALLFAFGWAAHLHAFFYVGAIIVLGLLAYEQSLVRPDDLSKVNLAFFTLNGWVSVSLFVFTLLDRLFIP